MLYRKFEVTLKFRDKIYGGLPKSKDLLKNYVYAKFGSEDTELTETDLDLEEETEKRIDIFRADANGIYIGTYQLKSAIKHAASTLKITVKKRGSKQTFGEGLFIKGIRDPKAENFTDETDFTENAAAEGITHLTGEKVYCYPLRKEADGVDEFAGHVDTPMGKRSILRALEYVEKPTLKFEVWVLNVRMGNDGRSKDITADDIEICLKVLEEGGIGANRTREVGKFDLISFKEITETKAKD